MATVYLGRVVGEGGFERLVALKVMHPHIASDPDFVGMFLDEARLAARIRHPNVVATIDIQKTDEAMFLVMDYVDGPTLQEIRKHLKSREERVPLGIALRFFIDILNGLQEAHELCDKDGTPLQLVHRDVSPHNILIGQDGRAQLTDFGVAKAEARISSTRGGQLKGKIAYMPPEQIIGQPVDRRADVYSAGVCLWECLVGKRLFRAPNDGALVHMILEGNPTPPSKYCDDIPPVVEGVLMKAISRQASDRYEEAVDFAEALEDAAREAKLKIPKQRAVAQFIKEVVTEIGKAPVSKRSMTPPSAPSESALSVTTGTSGVSAPSMPSMGSGPSKPHAFVHGADQPAARPGVPKSPPGPPPIPQIAEDLHTSQSTKVPRPGRAKPALPTAAKLRASRSSSRGLKRSTPTSPKNPGHVSTALPSPTRGAPRGKAAGLAPKLDASGSVEAASPAVTSTPTKSRPASLERPPIRFDEIEDPPTNVIDDRRAPAAVQDAVDNSQPSVVTSPTETAAIYSLAPPPSRHGMIAVVVAGVFLLIVLVAVFSGSPDTDETSLDLRPVTQPGATEKPVAPMPPPVEPKTEPAPTPPPSETVPAPPPMFTAPPKPTYPTIKPPTPSPSPSPNPFKPKGL
jgi:serine/threonine-protein kinase